MEIQKGNLPNARVHLMDLLCYKKRQNFPQLSSYKIRSKAFIKEY